MAPRIALIGTGNVGFHLARRLFSLGCPPNYILSQSIEKAQLLIETLSLNSRLLESHDLTEENLDFVIIAVPDNVVPEIVAKYKFATNTILLHTSGSQPMSLLASQAAYGVLYPLQTFSKEKIVDFSKILILIEGSDSTVLKKIQDLAQLLSGNVKMINSDQRLKIHIAAVFACNFTNKLFEYTEELLEGTDLELKNFQSLIDETTSKAIQLGAHKAQTGPAKRGDSEVISRHLEALSNQPELLNVYEVMSNLLMKKNKEE